MRCALCGQSVEIDDDDAVEIGGGLAHGDCFAERDDEGLFGEPDPATGRSGASFECSTAELERQARAARRSKERRKAG